MSCRSAPTFRLLDARVGWDADPHLTSSDALVGFDDEDGLTLAPLNPGEVSEADVLPYFGPSWISRGLAPCEWLLTSPRCTRLLRIRPGESAFHPWGPELGSADAVAADGRAIIAVSDRASECILLLDGVGRIRTRIAIADASLLALAPWAEVLVAAQGRVERFGLGGDRRGALPITFEQPLALRVDREHRLWVVHREASDALKLARFDRSGAAAELPDLALLPNLFPPTHIRLWRDEGLCWSDPKGPVSACIGRDGAALEASALAPFGIRRYRSAGTLLTLALDSLALRTVWHRVRVDADVPSGTSVSLAVATLDGAEEEPSQEAWCPAPAGSLDFLCSAPPGRYLRLRMTLSNGDEPTATPRVRQIRIDHPRSTSADLLPEVYRDEPRAADFSERFLSMFDAELEKLDDAIKRFPSALSLDAAPAASLAWLGTFLGASFGSGWTDERRRRFLRDAPVQYRKRGTPTGFAETLQLAAGLSAPPAILETLNIFGALDKTFRLSAHRLFGRNRRRFRLDRSALGEAPLRSYGNPDADADIERAFRFTVQFPAGAADTDLDRQRLTALVEALKPAHTAVQVRFGGRGFVVGWSSAVGIDTALTPLPPPVLGRSSRLSRRSVLSPSAASRHPALPLTGPIVGLSTSLGRSKSP